MDPLSITAAAAGLLADAAKISSPTTMKDAHIEVRHSEIARLSLQRLLQRLDAAATPRRGMI